MTTADASHGDDHVPVSTAQPFPRIELRFGHPSRGYDPGEWVTVEYCIEGLNGERPRALERSALWYTEGKGEEDLGVHSFERFATAETIDRVVPEGTFAIQLPTSPLSYEGVIVKIRWCIRLRVFFESGRDHVSEHVFNVGRVPPSILP
jgi:hypothetical protein